LSSTKKQKAADSGPYCGILTLRQRARTPASTRSLLGVIRRSGSQFPPQDGRKRGTNDESDMECGDNKPKKETGPRNPKIANQG